MVQLATVSITFVAILSGFVSAEAAIKGCTKSGIYCGYALKQKDSDYNYRINDALSAAGQSTDIKHTDHSIFICNSGNYITFDQYCPNGCVGGTTSDDYCSDQQSKLKRDMKNGERFEA